MYEDICTISYWEVLNGIADLQLPDYTGLTVSVHDSCGYRHKPQAHRAVRNLLRKMHVEIVEEGFTGTKSVCCGDNFYGLVPNEQVEKRIQLRASQLSCQDVVVYCIGCVRGMNAVGEMEMILLITGASHTGKTLLAQKLLKKYKYPYLSIDLLKMGLIRSKNTELTPEDDEELETYLWPIVREMVKTAIENKQNLIVEGCYIPLNWKEDFSEKYVREMQCYCLVMSRDYIEKNFSDIKKYGCNYILIEDDYQIEVRL